ncbi:MAG: hypothetical protein IIW69_07450 [Bacteroidaceae bacterium]|nr:hypothetical protein [Bacteroidaceae bacterium]
MKRLFLLSSLLVLFAFGASAQKDLRILNHLAIGAEVGTMGVGIDVAMPVTPFVDVQAGFTMFPNIKFNTSIDLSHRHPELNKIPAKGEVLMKGGKVLVNVMPLPIITSFHVTAGLYFGSTDVMGLYNTEPIPANYALALGDYLLEPNSDGFIDGKLKVNKVKPYLGIGIGRGVPKRRVGFKCDLGVVFWGKPSVYCNDTQIHDTDAGGDGDEVMKIISKFKVYPVLNFRICGRIF